MLANYTLVLLPDVSLALWWDYVKAATTGSSFYKYNSKAIPGVITDFFVRFE